LKASTETKNVEISDKREEIFKQGEDVPNKKDEQTATQKNWRESNVELKEVQDILAKMAAVIEVATVATSIV
jgi:hypothetical protein